MQVLHAGFENDLNAKPLRLAIHQASIDNFRFLFSKLTEAKNNGKSCFKYLQSGYLNPFSFLDLKELFMMVVLCKNFAIKKTLKDDSFDTARHETGHTM